MREHTDYHNFNWPGWEVLSLSHSKLSNKAYLFSDQNKSLNVQCDTNYKTLQKKSRASLGLLKGRRGHLAPVRANCEWLMNQQTNKKGHKSTQGQVVQISKGRANRQFVVMFMDVLPGKITKHCDGKCKGHRNYPTALQGGSSCIPADARQSFCYVLADFVRGSEATSGACILSALVYWSRRTNLRLHEINI